MAADEVVHKFKFYDSTDASYALTGTGKDALEYGKFGSLTGGDLKISMISYNVIGEKGDVETRWIPGQISYAPIKMSAEYSAEVENLVAWFHKAKDGNVDDMKKKCILTLNNVYGDEQASWTLHNTIPIALPGFSVHTFQKTKSVKFKVVLQAEWIEIDHSS